MQGLASVVITGIAFEQLYFAFHFQWEQFPWAMLHRKFYTNQMRIFRHWAISKGSYLPSLQVYVKLSLDSVANIIFSSFYTFI